MQVFSFHSSMIYGSPFIDYLFNYAPLTSMFCRKNLILRNRKKIGYRKLQVIYQLSDFYEHLLNCSSTVSIQKRHGFYWLKYASSYNLQKHPFRGVII